ncbi:hypothetical protein [Shinella sp. JR1-6]|uniref:hypothetical protein n=1 Tax=Shinella sp. JR1-6 TaxID=2527671 RepID=UPI00102D45FF|nr:hypothetical protein [Shinella sp. JR1-6]TAA60656.1 hypothetical protein EXZ48_12705 [Shinella sp. JR1-6]
MSVQLARYLKDFGAPPRPKMPTFQPPSFGDEGGGVAAQAFAMPPAEPPVDLAAERAEAFADGKAEAETELRSKHDAEITALKEAHQAELDSLKARYEKDYARALAERFSTLTGEVAERVAADTAEVLAPVMNDVLARGAVADLARMITEGLQGDEGMTITVKGPANLFQQLEAHFDEPAPVFRHVEMQDVDLTVEFGETVLVTRLAAWADTVRKVLA